MDATTVGAAWTAIKTATDIGKGLLALKIDTDVRLKVSEILDRLGETQDKLFQLREELTKLQQDNADLRQQNDATTDWNLRIGKYALTQTAGGAVVYKASFEPPHFACPSCVESRALHILQDTNTYGGTFVCPKCDKHFPIRRPRQPPRRQASIVAF